MNRAVKPNGYGRGENPNSLAALAAHRRPPRRTGAAANPNGRPPAGESFNDALRYWLDKTPQEMLGFMFGELSLSPERNNMRHVLAYAQVMQSLFDQTSRTFTMNKLDGMPKQQIEQQVTTTEKWEQVQQAGTDRLRRVK